MNTAWTLGVLGADAESVHHLASGVEASRAGAVEAASDALVAAAMDRGRLEYRISVADTRIVVTPGLTEGGDVDLLDLDVALSDLESLRS